MSVDPTLRVAIESASNPEAKAVLAEIQRMESAGLKPDEATDAIVALKYGLRAWRDDQLSYHRAELDKAQAKYERDAERRASPEGVKLQRLRTRVDGMSDDEVENRAVALIGADRLDGDEVDLISARLRNINGAGPSRDELRRVATDLRAWEPWTHTGAGKEHADAVNDLMQRGFHTVSVDYDGTRLEVPITSVLDMEGKMDRAV